MDPTRVNEHVWEEALLEGADRLGINLSREGLMRLKVHQRCIVRWSSKVNLTAILTPKEMAEYLYLDSACLVPLLDGDVCLHDVGTGAGFPGLVLKAIAPDLQVTLSESRRKKVVFLRQAAYEMGLKSGLEIHHTRVGQQKYPAGILWSDVVSRAAFPPEEWIEIGKELVALGGRLWLFFNQRFDERTRFNYNPPNGFKFHLVHHYKLPFCQKERSLVCLKRSQLASVSKPCI